MAGQLPTALIDAHCHVFNAKDLPAITFINTVLRERYGKDPDGLMPGVGLIIEVISGNAPRAADELADILGKPRPPTNGGVAFAGQAMGTGNQQNNQTLDAQSQGGILSWLHLFALSRRELIAKLSAIYSNTGKHCVLMAPALVDYDAWLKNPEKQYQRLSDQVAVMGQISRQKGATRVHGFMGFDPIRAILAEVGRNPVGVVSVPPIDPLRLLDDAITRHGFLGVKLYPPMGFRAWRNDDGIDFPQYVRDDVNSDGISNAGVGKLIDQQLAKLYTYCADKGVPILAHAYNSNQAGQCFGWRASPQYWGEVIQKFSTPEKPLHISLAHFGRFAAHTVNPQCVTGNMAAQVWEILFGNILKGTAAGYVFADLSYFSEVLDRSDGWQARRQALRDKLRKYVDTYDPDVEHICYGSDWVMLGIEQGSDRFHEELGSFLRDDVGLTSEQLGRVFFGNGMRFLGLQPGQQNRTRLEQFYKNNNIWDLFPQLDALA